MSDYEGEGSMEEGGHEESHESHGGHGGHAKKSGGGASAYFKAIKSATQKDKPAAAPTPVAQAPTPVGQPPYQNGQPPYQNGQPPYQNGQPQYQTATQPYAPPHDQHLNSQGVHNPTGAPAPGAAAVPAADPAAVKKEEKKEDFLDKGILCGLFSFQLTFFFLVLPSLN